MQEHSGTCLLRRQKPSGTSFALGFAGMNLERSRLQFGNLLSQRKLGSKWVASKQHKDFDESQILARGCPSLPAVFSPLLIHGWCNFSNGRTKDFRNPCGTSINRSGWEKCVDACGEPIAINSQSFKGLSCVSLQLNSRNSNKRSSSTSTSTSTSSSSSSSSRSRSSSGSTSGSGSGSGSGSDSGSGSGSRSGRRRRSSSSSSRGK